MIFKFGLFTALFFAANALCSQKLFANELKWTHFGLRPLGMGNAYVAVADDYNALFYNPAGLARLKTWSFEIINPQIGVSANTVSTINDVTALLNGGASDSSGKSSVQSALEIFETLSGKPQYVNVGLTPHLVFPGFGFGIGTDIGGSLVVHRQISAEVDAGIEAIIPVSYAKNFLDDRLSIGATIKGVFKAGVEREFSLSDISAFTKSSSTTTSTDKKLKDYLINGKGVGADLGMLFTPVKPMEPTLGVSITDFGGTPLKASSSEYGTPKPRDPTVNTGVSFKPYNEGKSYFLTAIDAHGINRPMHFSKKFNLGTEWGYGSVIKIQAGLHQGEFSGGLQLDAWLLVLRFATYAEQLGPTAGEDKNFVDRRYIAQLKMLL
ncbi:MAG: hypothetical protein NT027_07720 [Proteobacteria bacterium]|nr:hypothetical protein [Pseudomonadota bacterium]